MNNKSTKAETVAEWKLIIPHVGRDFSDDDWRTLEPRYIETWKEAHKFHDGISLKLGDRTFRIIFDFTPIIEKFEDLVGRMTRLIDEKDQSAFEDYDYDEVVVPIKSECISDTQKNDHWVTASIIQSLIYQVFLSMNLCVPGSCNLYSSYLIKDPPETGYRGRDTRHEVDLRSRSFEASLFEAEKYQWLKRIPFTYTQVQQWLEIASPTFCMVPIGPVSRSTLALAHLAKSEEGPMSIIWIFYALESLFKCRVGENFNALSNRISLLLNLSEADKKLMKKRFRELYDIRSSIVHGGAEIVHPLRNEVLDKRVDDTSWKYVMAADFGSALIIRSLQEMIKRESFDLNFKEEIAY